MGKTKRIKNYDEFMSKNYIICPHCGYNNKKDYFVNYGTCLRCGKIIDQKVFFENKLKIELRKTNKKYGVL